MREIIEFVEPHPIDGAHCTVSISKYDAIKYQRRAAKANGFKYEDDEEALEDFMTIHWAKLVEEE